MKAIRYVALLRGINVGGNNIIPMKALVATFEGLKLANVSTFIASGNVLFESPERDARALEKRIEKALSKAFDYDATVVVKSKAEMDRIVDGLPTSWKRVDAKRKYNVVFLRHEIDDATILDGLAPKPGIEEVAYGPGAIYWSAKTSDLARTSMVKLSSKAIYKHVTVRNLNTTKKIHELL